MEVSEGLRAMEVSENPRRFNRKMPGNWPGIILIGVGYLVATCCLYSVGQQREIIKNTSSQFHSKMSKMQEDLDQTKQQLRKCSGAQNQLESYSPYQRRSEFRQKRYIKDSNISEQLKWLNEGVANLKNEINDVHIRIDQMDELLQLQDNRLNESETALRLLDKKAIEFIHSSLAQNKINVQIGGKLNFLERQFSDFSAAIILKTELQAKTASERESKLNLTNEMLLERQSKLSQEIHKLEIFKRAVVDAVDLGKALYAAVVRNDLETVTVLGEMKVNTENEDQDGNRPLHQAVRYSRVNIAEVLLRAGAQVGSINKNSYTPLHWAAIEGCFKCAMLLLANGANFDAQDQHKNTPLMMASARGYNNILSLLISAGAKINTPNELGHTSAEYATISGNCDSLQILVNNGADVISTAKGTLIHLAVENQHLECVKILMKYGASISAKNEFGETPLDVAMDLKLEDIVSLLKKANV